MLPFEQKRSNKRSLRLVGRKWKTQGVLRRVHVAKASPRTLRSKYPTSFSQGRASFFFFLCYWCWGLCFVWVWAETGGGGFSNGQESKHHTGFDQPFAKSMQLRHALLRPSTARLCRHSTRKPLSHAARQECRACVLWTKARIWMDQPVMSRLLRESHHFSFGLPSRINLPQPSTQLT